MNQYHLNVTNNMSGIPPSSQGASKFAKQIQRELEKLEQEVELSDNALFTRKFSYTQSYSR